MGSDRAAARLVFLGRRQPDANLECGDESPHSMPEANR
jgi:hypothetical protein